MKKKIKQLFFVLTLTLSLTLPYLAFGQIQGNNNPMKKLGSVTEGVYADADEYSMAGIIGTIVRTALSLLGIVFVVLIIIAGFKWMNAGGNEKEVEESQARMKNAIIGLVITMAAYGIYQFIDSYIIVRGGLAG